MQTDDPNNAPNPLVYDQGLLWLVEKLQTDPRSCDESDFWMMATLLNRYGEALFFQFAFLNGEQNAFYVHQTKQTFGKQGCRQFPFENCSRHKGYDAEGYGPQKRIYKSKEGKPIVLYQYWFGPRQKAQNEGYSLLVVMPARRQTSRRRQNLLSAENPPTNFEIESETVYIDLSELFPDFQFDI